MSLRDEIREITSQLSLSEIIKELGYSNANIFKVSTRIRHVTQSNSLGLDSTHYDFRYSNREFLIRLCEVIGIDPGKCLNEIERINTKIAEEKYSYKPWVFIDTKFKRKNEPIFALAAMEYARRIHLPRRIYTLPLESQIPFVKRIIRRHHIESGDKIPLWGVISYYKYFYAKHEFIIFDVDASEIAQGGGVEPPYAKVSIKGKGLFKSM